MSRVSGGVLNGSKKVFLMKLKIKILLFKVVTQF